MDVHEFDRDIAAGQSRIAEYGAIANDRRPVRTVLQTKIGWGKVEVELAAVTAGWACAGSMARWDNGYYAVHWDIDGSRHGARYKTLAEAEAHFARIPTKRYGE